MAPVRRGYIGALIDRLAGWADKLPAETNSYSVERLRVPLGDGAEVSADLYRPLLAAGAVAVPAGTLLARCPYGIDIPMSVAARLLAARGYQVLFSACRGTADSADGSFDPGRDEAADGQATVAWMRRQPWYTGSFATFGSSYLGYTQWALLADPPAEMRAAVIHTGPHSFAEFAYGTGAFRSDTLAWADFTARMNGPGRMGFVALMWYLRGQKRRLRAVLDAAPLLDAVDAHSRGATPVWLRHQITRRPPSTTVGTAADDAADAYWGAARQDAALERANIPILLVTGWYDLLRPSVMLQYDRLAARGCPVALTVGPWTHVGAGPGNSFPETLAWIDEHLAARAKAVRPDPVRVFVTGAAAEWRPLPAWPPPATSSRELFLGPDHQLLAAAPVAAARSEFVFDPADPTPSVGMPELFGNTVDNDDTALAARRDVLTFLTPPLDGDVEVCGRPVVELAHSSDHPHVDLLVQLSEVDRNGRRSRRIAERYVRLGLDGAAQPPLRRLVLGDCAHRFAKGSRIRLIVAGGAHPLYVRNLGTGGDPATGSELRPARHTVRHGADAVSKLVLPLTAAAR